MQWQLLVANRGALPVGFMAISVLAPDGAAEKRARGFAKVHNYPPTLADL
jgi:hypothetical protein